MLRFRGPVRAVRRDFPDRTSALALFAPAVVGAATQDYPWAWSEATWSSYMDELASGWGTRSYAEKVFPGFNPSLADDDRAIGWWAKFMRQAASPNAVVAIERMWREIDVRPVLRRSVSRRSFCIATTMRA